MKVVKFNYKTLGASLLLSACASLSMDPPMESQGDTLVKSLNREKLNNVPAIKTIAPSGDLGLSVDMPFGIPFDMNVFEEDVTTEFSDSLNNELGVDINRLVLNNISEFKDWNNFFSNIVEDDTNFVLTQNTLKEDLLEINSEKEILLNKIKEASALIKKNYAEMLILLGEDKSQGESLFNSGCIYIQSLEKTVRNKIDVLNAKDYSLTVDKYEHEIMLSNNKIIDSGKRIRDLNGVKDKIKINIIKDSLVSCNRILSNLGIFMFDPDENFSDEKALSLNNNIINIIDSLSKKCPSGGPA